MEVERKWRWIGLCVPVVILFIMWNIETKDTYSYYGLYFNFQDGSFVRWLANILGSEYDIFTDRLTTLIYIILNILSFTLRAKTGTFLKKLFLKV